MRASLERGAGDPERQQHPAAGEVAQHVDRRRWLLAGATQRLERAGERDVVDVVPGGVRHRPVLAPAGQAAVHEPRVAGGALVGADAEALGDARPEHFEEHVGLLDQPQQRLDALRQLEVDRHRLLAPVHGRGRGPGAVDRPRGIDPVDPQHLGAHVGEQHPAERPRAQAHHLHHPETVERTTRLNRF